jgi:hypothetical protein
MFSKELVPEFANELTALILPEDADDPIVLNLNVSLELLNGIEHVALLAKCKHPAVLGGVVNESKPIANARDCQCWHLMQIAVNVLKRNSGAMWRLVGKRGLMMLAMDTRDADASKWIVAVELKTCSKCILDHKLNLIASNVTQALMPERLHQGCLGCKRCLCNRWCADIQVCCAASNGRHEAQWALLWKGHWCALNLNAKAMPGDKMQHREQTVLKVRDIEHICHLTGQKWLIWGLNHNCSNVFAIHNSVVCNTDRNAMRLVVSEPLSMRRHMQCSTGVSNPGEVRRWFRHICTLQQGTESNMGVMVIRRGWFWRLWIDGWGVSSSCMGVCSLEASTVVLNMAWDATEVAAKRGIGGRRHWCNQVMLSNTNDAMQIDPLMTS